MRQINKIRYKKKKKDLELNNKVTNLQIALFNQNIIIKIINIAFKIIY